MLGINQVLFRISKTVKLILLTLVAILSFLIITGCSTSYNWKFSYSGITIYLQSEWNPTSSITKENNSASINFEYQDSNSSYSTSRYIISIYGFDNGETESLEALDKAEHSPYYLDQCTFKEEWKINNDTTVSLYDAETKFDGIKKALVLGYDANNESGFCVEMSSVKNGGTGFFDSSEYINVAKQIDFDSSEVVPFKIPTNDSDSNSSSPSSSDSSSSSSSSSSTSSNDSGTTSSNGGDQLPTTPSMVTDEQLKGMLLASAKTVVEEHLKSPSSASFPWGFDSYSFKDYGMSSDHPGYDRYLITGYVDAENSFGAKTRTNWLVEMDYKSSDRTYYVIRFDFS